MVIKLHRLTGGNGLSDLRVDRTQLTMFLALLAPLPALAQDADPSNQLLEGYVACAMGERLTDKTVTA